MTHQTTYVTKSATVVRITRTQFYRFQKSYVWLMPIVTATRWFRYFWFRLACLASVNCHCHTMIFADYPNGQDIQEFCWFRLKRPVSLAQLSEWPIFIWILLIWIKVRFLLPQTYLTVHLFKNNQLFTPASLTCHMSFNLSTRRNLVTSMFVKVICSCWNNNC